MKKVLVIVYYWPPSGGAGVQRWLKFVKYLPTFGWKPTVITTQNGDYPAIDYSLVKEVLATIKVIRTKTPAPGRWLQKASKQNAPYGSLETNSNDSILKKAAIWLRLNLVIPDARKVWNRYALQAAIKELQTDKYDTIITSGPPHSTHLIGLSLKKKFKLKWLADFRDPWTKIDYLEKVNRLSITNFLDKKLEQKVVTECDRILSINHAISSSLKASSKTAIIPNGFDPTDFAKIEKQKTTKFQINYFGNITAERNPKQVLRAINIIYPLCSRIELNFWGNISTDIRNDLWENDNNHIVVFHEYVPHDIMLQKMINSSVLLLLINNVPANSGILTGKIYEYLGAKVPVLAIGPVTGDAAAILNETSAGKIFDYKDMGGISEFLKSGYQDWQNGFEFKSSKSIEKYNRKKQTEELADLLHQL